LRGVAEISYRAIAEFIESQASANALLRLRVASSLSLPNARVVTLPQTARPVGEFAARIQRSPRELKGVPRDEIAKDRPSREPDTSVHDVKPPTSARFLDSIVIRDRLERWRTFRSNAELNPCCAKA
jgi:hypothetical protein